MEAIDEHTQLNWFIGSWDVQSKMLIDGQWVEDQSSSNISSILDGKGLLETFDGAIKGESFKGISLRTYNPKLGKWEQRWLDNQLAGFLAYTGEWDGQQFTAYAATSFKPEGDGGRGEKIGVREVFYDIQSNRFSWKLERSTDGGESWQQVWALEYTRK